MKKIMFLLVLTVIRISTFGQDTINVYDVRNVKWGMNKYEVKQNEKLSFSGAIENNLIYRGKVLSYESTLYYKFINNKLVSLYILLGVNNSNNNVYVDDYNQIKSSLKKKYGDPKEENIIWKDNTLKNDANYIGMAIASQDVKFSTVWKTEKSNIILLMYGDDKYNIKISIIYGSIKDEEIIRNDMNNINTDDL